MKRGVCFSGGGIKCAAHIGAVRAFEEYGIEFDCISGTSSGSIIAVLYALGYSADEMYAIIKKYAKSIGYIEIKKVLKFIADLVLYRKVKIDGLNSGKKLEKLIEKICQDKGVRYISEIKKEIIIPSVDLCDGKIYIFNSIKAEKVKQAENRSQREYSDNVIYDNKIKISEAVRASCSYPGVFCPYGYKGRKLIDGGIRENMPWRQLQELGMDEVWGITFSKNTKNDCEKNVFEVIGDSIGILCHELSNYELDGMVDRINIVSNNVELLDYRRIDYLCEKGYFITKKFIEGKK